MTAISTPAVNRWPGLPFDLYRMPPGGWQKEASRLTKSSGLTVELAILGMYNEAIKGNVQAFSVLADRTEGKPMQVVQMFGPGGGAIPVTSMTPEENERRIAELLAKGGMT